MLKKLLIGSLFVVYPLLGISNEDIPTKKTTAGSQLTSATEVSIKNTYLKLANDIQRYAKKFIGTPYLKGGKATKGFDCSGFVIYVFAKFGLKLGACSSELVKLGYDVPSEAALPGDLIFFKRGANSKSGVSHVGIVLSSNEAGVKFIHSATSSGVTISYLHEKYYTTHFVGIRRVLDSLKDF
ncbi:C40 family peptidase [Emticicia sp. SJ17W-69]|uniref:C40 family peptidase n=1 Tax=Emticicia sp. SJ17W-69 TaxID=3421657 RepID=UPI003EBB54AA